MSGYILIHSSTVSVICCTPVYPHGVAEITAGTSRQVYCCRHEQNTCQYICAAWNHAPYDSRNGFVCCYQVVPPEARCFAWHAIINPCSRISTCCHSRSFKPDRLRMEDPQACSQHTNIAEYSYLHTHQKRHRTFAWSLYGTTSNNSTSIMNNRPVSNIYDSRTKLKLRSANTLNTAPLHYLKGK